ncbi:hypothetical protein [Streptomyces hiroshimensis]|uniref:hypothetical protein n=1 Tax=Streptomyces hiroshimensis TaxID=66424 RepID=UPI0016735D3B|nr:hypothetical protein [Streptomyces hiroshimensis]
MMQLITAGAALSGVMLSLLANAYLERRRARDVRALEVMRVDLDRVKWLREERVKAYGGLSLAGEEAQQFIRSELPLVLGPDGAARRAAVEDRWRELRTELRKAYDQVALFGSEQARAEALRIWQVARNGANDFLQEPDTDGTDRAARLAAQIRSVASELGTAGNRFLEACRRDLQGE